MATIGVDIDSTLYDFETPFRDAFFKLAKEQEDSDTMQLLLKGAYHVWDEWRSPADVCGLDMFLQALDIVHSDECILSRKPFEGSVETLQALHNEGHRLRYISNRRPESSAATKQWLEEAGFPVRDPESVVCMMDSKKAHLRDCMYLIDDRPRTLVEFVYGTVHPVKAFGLMYPYNRALTDIPSVYLALTWSGLNHYLVRENVLNEVAYEPLEVS
jgi:hypothetical protein